MGCGLSRPENGSQIRKRFSFIKQDEFRALELIYCDIASRNIYGHLDYDNFLHVFSTNGLWGERLFRQLDLNGSNSLSKEEFILGIRKLLTNQEKQKQRILFSYYCGPEAENSSGISSAAFIQMLSISPLPVLKKIFSTSDFFTAEIQDSITYLRKQLSVIEDYPDNETIIGGYLEDESNHSSCISEISTFWSKPAKERELEEKFSYSFVFHVGGKRVKIMAENLYVIIRKYTSMVFKKFQLDCDHGILSKKQFQQWINQSLIFLESYFANFYQGIWGQQDDKIAYLTQQPLKESSAYLLVYRQKEIKVELMLLSDILIIHEPQKKENLIEIICLSGLEVTASQDKSFGHAIKVSHRNGVYKEKNLFFEMEEEASQWLELLKDFQGVSFYDQYCEGEQIGRGRYSTVFECFDKKSKKVFAVKQIPTYLLKADEKPILENESKILSVLSHPNLPKFEKCFCTKTHRYIVMDRFKGENLFDFVKKRGFVNEGEAACIAREIIQGVRSFHKLGIVHRDLKPENILINWNEGNQKPDVKIIDFGFADYISKINSSDSECKEEFISDMAVGTPNFLAPEILEKNKISEKIDVFSIGAILFYILSGALPFVGQSIEEIFEKTKRGVINFVHACWNSVSQSGKEFLCLLLETNPNSRIDLKSALRHKWMGLPLRTEDSVSLASPKKRRTLKSLVF